MTECRWGLAIEQTLARGFAPTPPARSPSGGVFRATLAIDGARDYTPHTDGLPSNGCPTDAPIRLSRQLRVRSPGPLAPPPTPPRGSQPRAVCLVRPGA